MRATGRHGFARPRASRRAQPSGSGPPHAMDKGRGAREGAVFSTDAEAWAGAAACGHHMLWHALQKLCVLRIFRGGIAHRLEIRIVFAKFPVLFLRSKNLDLNFS
jgi:hypothetical protein